MNLDLVLIPGGEFWMGDDNGREDERPPHLVRLKPFLAAVRPVSSADYATFMKATGATEPRFSGDDRFNDPLQPVVGVSWNEAVSYCRWLSRSEGVRTRLPTEAEREYAALGGLETARWPWGDEAPSDRPEMAPIATLERPHVPRPECANGYGLLCMGENVHEWCSDWYDPRYYHSSAKEDPRGPATGQRKSSRGGAWRHQVKFARVCARSSLAPTSRYNDYGFRVYADA